MMLAQLIWKIGPLGIPNNKLWAPKRSIPNFPEQLNTSPKFNSSPPKTYLDPQGKARLSKHHFSRAMYAELRGGCTVLADKFSHFKPMVLKVVSPFFSNAFMYLANKFWWFDEFWWIMVNFFVLNFETPFVSKKTRTPGQKKRPPPPPPPPLATRRAADLALRKEISNDIKWHQMTSNHMFFEIMTSC